MVCSGSKQRSRKKPRAQETGNPKTDKGGLHGALRLADRWNRKARTTPTQEKMEAPDETSVIDLWPVHTVTHINKMCPHIYKHSCIHNKCTNT